MKKLLLIIPMAFIGCEKENQQPQKSECDCYKQFQENLFGYYENTNQSAVVVDSCSLDGQMVQYEQYKRYFWVCE